MLSVMEMPGLQAPASKSVLGFNDFEHFESKQNQCMAKGSQEDSMALINNLGGLNHAWQELGI